MDDTNNPGWLADSSGNGHHADQTGANGGSGLSYERPGIIGESIVFDQGYARVTHHQDLVMTHKMTVMGWINPLSDGTYQPIIAKWPTSYVLYANAGSESGDVTFILNGLRTQTSFLSWTT